MTDRAAHHTIAPATPDAQFDASGGSDDAARGAVPLLGRILLVVAIPLSILWYPLTRIPGLGTVTANDVVLIALWAVTGVGLFAWGSAATAVKPVSIALIAVAIGALAGVGSELAHADGQGFLEFGEFMKRFGLASIIPTAALLFRSRAMGTWTRVATLAVAVAMAVATFVPEIASSLPVSELEDPSDTASRLGGRASGLVTNPNDLSYCALGLLLLHGCLVPRRPRASDVAMVAANLVASIVCMVAAGSRSGVLGAAGGVVYLLCARGLRPRTKAVVAAAVAVSLVAGFSYGSVFRERIGQAARLGVQDANVSSRIDMQLALAELSLEQPFGVGYRGIERASSTSARLPWVFAGSDSVYFDTLMGAGFLGLFLLVGLFVLGWLHATSRMSGGQVSTAVLRAGIIAYLVIGTATVAPIDVFVSTTFFSLLGAASYLESDLGAEQPRDEPSP